MVHQVFGRVNTDAAPPSLNTNLSTSNLTTNGQPNGAASDDDTAATEAENSAQATQGEDEHTRGGDGEAEKELKRQSLQDQIIAEAALARRETLNVADSKSPADILGDTEQVFEDESVPEALAGSSVQTREQVAPSDPVPTQEDHQADEKEGENTPAIDNPEAEDEADTV